MTASELMIMSAAEARLKTNSVRQDKKLKELQYIEVEIKKAIGRGNYEVEVDRVSEDVTKILIQKGYTVRDFQEYNETYSVIAWRE